MQYNTWFDTCAFLIFSTMILMYLTRKSVRILQNSIFFGMLLCMTGAAFLDIVSAALNGKNTAAVFAVNTLIWVLDIATALTFAVYVSAFISYNVERSRIYQILAAPALGALLLLATNFYTGAVFYVDEAAFYQRGQLSAVLSVIQFCYLLCGMAMMFRLRMQITREKLALMLPFVVLVIIFGIIQFMAPSLLLQKFGYSLLAVSMYLGLQNPEELFDRESGMMNLPSFVSQVERRLKYGMNCQILVMALRNGDMIQNLIGDEGMNELKKEIFDFVKQYEERAMLFRVLPGVIILVPNDEGYDETEIMMQQIVNRFRMPFLKDFYEIEVNACCCHFDAPGHARTIDEVRSVVTLAVKTGRRLGLDVVDMVDLDLPHEVYMKEIDEKVRNAVREEKLEVYYQPIYSTKERRFVAAEALLRMHDDEHGFVSPAVFIPVAEANGSVVEIDRFVTDSVLRIFAENDMEKVGLHYVEMNLSPTDCIQEDLVEFMEQRLNAFSVDPSKLNLEITETAGDALTNVVDENVRELYQKGFSFSLDDFGTGYSSMSRIVELPLSIIKIDKSIVQPAFDEKLSEKERENAATLLRSYVDMIKRLGCEIVTEGVETKEQAIEIIRLGCDYIQGFYFSKPLNEKTFIKMLDQQARHPEGAAYPEIYGALE